MLSNWVAAREKKMRDTIAENVRLQNKMNAKRFEWGKSFELQFEKLEQQTEDLRTHDRIAMRRALQDLRSEFTPISLPVKQDQ